MTFSLYVTFWLSSYAAIRILRCLIQAWIISRIWHKVVILWRWQTLKSIILMFISWAQLRHKCERPPRATPTLLHSRWASQCEKHRCTNCACVWCTAKNICRMYGLLKGHKTHAEREREDPHLQLVRWYPGRPLEGRSDPHVFKPNWIKR